MKLILVSLTLAFGLNAFASEPGYKKVADERVYDYQKAIQAAIHQNPSVITGCDPQWVNNTFNYVHEILVNTENAQPLVLFNTFYNGDLVMHRLAFFTDPSLKNLTKVHAETFRKGEVNQGDLANPVIVEDYLIQGRWDCALKDQFPR